MPGPQGIFPAAALLAGLVRRQRTGEEEKEE